MRKFKKISSGTIYFIRDDNRVFYIDNLDNTTRESVDYDAEHLLACSHPGDRRKFIEIDKKPKEYVRGM
jgi:hypothetical protein